MVGDWLTAAVSASAPLSRAMPPWQSANRGNAWELREGQWVDVSADFQGMSEGEMTELGSELIVVGYACSMVLKQGRNFDRKKPDCASFRGPDVYVTSAKYLAKGKHTVWLEAANQLDKQPQGTAAPP